MTATFKPPRRRSWFSFSMRSMLLTMIVVAIPLGWVSRKIGRAMRQRQAVIALQATGWQVEFDHAAAVYPNWLRKLLGEDAFRNVKSVDNRRPGMVTDAQLEQFRGFTDVMSLDLDGARVTDAGMASVGTLVHLQNLYLEKTRISDAGLAQLADLRELTSLRLYKTNVTDAGLGHLKKMSRLDTLVLDHTRVTDAGLIHLYGLKGLRKLVLDGTGVTENGVRKLQEQLPELEIGW